MKQRYFVDADVTFLTAAEGGRSAAPPLDHPTARYRPHIVIGDIAQRLASSNGNLLTETYLGVEFQPQQATIIPGETTRVRLGLMFYPAPAYDAVQPGVTFTIREGSKIVGYGRLISGIVGEP